MVSEVGSSTAVLFAGAPEKAVAPKPAGSSDSAFRAVLPDGTVIELVGLCEHPSAGHDWWRPDGSPLGRIPDGEAPQELAEHAWNVHLGNPHALDRDIAIEATLPKGEVELTRYYLGGIGSASTFKKSDDKKVLQSLRAVAQFRPNSRTTLLVRYAPDPWETYVTSKPWGILRGGQRRRSASAAVVRSIPTGGGVILARPSEEAGTSTIMAAFDLDDVEHHDFRIIAVDKAGITLPGRHGDSPNAKIPLMQMKARNAHLLMANFEKTPLEQIETFLFQSRKFQSVTFHNVSLHRDQRTNFEVHVGDEPPRQTTRYSNPGSSGAATQSDPKSAPRRGGLERSQ